MKPAVLALGVCAALALAGCDKPKPRHLPPDPMGASADLVPDDQIPIGEGLSIGLQARPGMPGFSLDHTGDTADPLNHQPAVTAAHAPILLDGFGFDAVAKAPAKGVDVVVDGKAWPTRYGIGRRDVARYVKNPALVSVGFTTVLPAGALAPGLHTAVVRVISTDGKGYYDSLSIPFTVK
jgi:hypothetical protein